jgi:uncharacterized protein YidB (DUF937 family)
MGILDSILGGLLGGNANASPLQSILGSILGGGSSSGATGGGGLGGLLQQFQRAGHGDAANSWVSNGPNQPISPGALQDVFGQDRVNQWSQQSGMPAGDLLSQLSNLIPHAVNHMTPEGQVPPNSSQSGSSPFDEGGVELR